MYYVYVFPCPFSASLIMRENVHEGVGASFPTRAVKLTQPSRLLHPTPAVCNAACSCRKTCEMLRQIVSGDPMDRPSMPVVTAFLRDLAGKTAALEETRAAVPQGIDPPPDTATPVIPPVVAPHAEGEDNGAGAAVLLVEAIETPRSSSPHVSAPHGSAPPAVPARPVAIPAVLPVVAPHSEGEERGAGAAVPLVEANEEPHSSV